MGYIREYANGVKLKEPTIGDMLKIARVFKPLIETADQAEINKTMIEYATGEKLVEILKIACEGDLNTLSPTTFREVRDDFFTTWQPLGWISENISTIANSLQVSLPAEE